jgi:hypothetical protein
LNENPNFSGGGGGGAGFQGKKYTSTSSNENFNGGDGLESSISGTSTYYAGGGGGGHYNMGRLNYSGGRGGGGEGRGGTNDGTTTLSKHGNINSGGGGGGGPYGNTNSAAGGGNGGSGIVIITYLSAGDTPAPVNSKVLLWEVNFENLLGNMFRNYERFNICLKYISGITSVSNKNALVKLSGLPFTNVYNLGGKNNTDIVIASLSFNLDTIQQNYSIPQYYQFTQQKNAYILISLLDISDGTDCKALINQCVFSFDITGDENFKKYLN